MIKRAAAAGAVAWTAPIIIDSLASPAAAATVAPGCYRAYFPSANTCVQSTLVPVGGDCLPTGWPATNLESGLVTSSNCANATTPVTFTLAADVSCYFAYGQVQKSGPATCIPGVIAPDGKTISFTKANGSWQDGGFRLTITCGGVACT